MTGIQLAIAAAVGITSGATLHYGSAWLLARRDAPRRELQHAIDKTAAGSCGEKHEKAQPLDEQVIENTVLDSVTFTRDAFEGLAVLRVRGEWLQNGYLLRTITADVYAHDATGFDLQTGTTRRPVFPRHTIIHEINAAIAAAPSRSY